MENNIIELKPFMEMGALKLKREIVESLDNLNEKYLRAVHALIRSLEEEESDWYDELDDRTKKDIGIGLEQADAGELIHNDEVMAEFRAKYGK